MNKAKLRIAFAITSILTVIFLPAITALVVISSMTALWLIASMVVTKTDDPKRENEEFFIPRDEDLYPRRKESSDE